MTGESADWRSAILSMTAQAAASRRTSIVMIGTTARAGNPPLIIAPPRESRDFVSCSFIIRHADQLLDICTFTDGKADYIFIDAENKTPESPSFVALARSAVRRSRVKTYKGNDITVLASDLLISHLLPDLSQSRAAIIGAGNIGAKLALILAERGATVNLCRRDDKGPLLSSALNVIKNKYAAGQLAPAASLTEASEGAHLLVGLTQGYPVITEEMIAVLSPKAIIIDAGIGTLQEEAVLMANALGHRLYRLDIRIAFPTVIDSILFTERFLNETAGRVVRDGKHYVAGGVIGKKGDIVVDSIRNPSRIIGIADGRGGISRHDNLSCLCSRKEETE